MIKYKYPRFCFGDEKEDNIGWAKSRFISLGLIIIIFISGYVAIISNFFKVSDIEIIGAQEYDKERIMELALARVSRRKMIIFKESSLFFYSISGLEEDIKNNFPIDSVVLDKDFPNKLTIKVERMKDVLTALSMVGTSTASNLGSTLQNLESSTTVPGASEYENLRLNGVFMLDKFGKVIRKVEDDGGKIMPIVEIDSLKSVAGETGEELIARDSAAFILELHRQWPDIINIAIDKYVLKDLRPTEIIVKTGEGWEAIFSILHPYEKQIRKLKLFMDEKFAKESSRKGVKYIDLKTPDKVFWK